MRKVSISLVLTLGIILHTVCAHQRTGTESPGTHYTRHTTLPTMYPQTAAESPNTEDTTRVTEHIPSTALPTTPGAGRTPSPPTKNTTRRVRLTLDTVSLCRQITAHEGETPTPQHERAVTLPSPSRRLGIPSRSMCNAYCENLTEIANMRPPVQVLITILDYCLRAEINSSSAEEECGSVFGFIEMLCRNAFRGAICGAICAIPNHETSIPTQCRRDFCLERIRDPRVGDAFSAQLHILGVRNFMSMLEVEEVTDAIENALEAISNSSEMLDDDSARGIFETYDGVFGPQFVPMWERMRREDAKSVFGGLDKAATQIGKDFMRGARVSRFYHMGENLVIDVGRHRPQQSRDSKFSFPTAEVLENSSLASMASIEIPFAALCDEEEGENCSVVISVSVVDNFAEYLDESIRNFTDVSNTTRFPGAVLVSANIFGSSNYREKLNDNPIRLTFTPKASQNDTGSITYDGVFLNDTTFNWSEVGLKTEPLSNGIVTVVSTHLTSFTVLVTLVNKETFTSETEQTALNIVTYIGCGVSIVSLLLTIGILLILRKKMKKGVLLYIHLNLCIALLLALTLFVAGLEPAAANSVLCTVVAALLQYFFLCVFCWMLSEGIMLYLLVVRVFGKLAKRWYFLLILGWGVPVPIVAVSVGLLHSDYGTQDYCWIRAEITQPAIWTFVAPMIIVILINAVILVLTVSTIMRIRKVGGAECNVRNYDLAKTAVKGSIVLLPLLGLTWAIGLFAVNSNTTVFAWLFTILNSLQGFFIFLLHVVRNEVFLKKVKSCFSRLSPTGSRSKTGTTETKLKNIGQKGTVMNPLYGDPDPGLSYPANKSSSDIEGSSSDIKGSSSDIKGSSSDIEGSSSDIKASSAAAIHSDVS